MKLYKVQIFTKRKSPYNHYIFMEVRKYCRDENCLIIIEKDKKKHYFDIETIDKILIAQG